MLILFINFHLLNISFNPCSLFLNKISQFLFNYGTKLLIISYDSIQNQLPHKYNITIKPLLNKLISIFRSTKMFWIPQDSKVGPTKKCHKKECDKHLQSNLLFGYFPHVVDGDTKLKSLRFCSSISDANSSPSYTIPWGK